MNPGYGSSIFLRVKLSKYTIDKVSVMIKYAPMYIVLWDF